MEETPIRWLLDLYDFYEMSPFEGECDIETYYMVFLALIVLDYKAWEFLSNDGFLARAFVVMGKKILCS